MNETLDAATLTADLARAGVDTAIIARLATAVRTSGAGAVHAMGAGAFADWKLRLAVNALIAQAFDEGATRETLARDLESAAESLAPELALV